MKSFLAISCLAASSAAHTIFTEFWVNGVSQGFMQGVRTVEYDGPIMDVTSPDIVCNSASNTFSKPFPPTKIINVPAGASATAEWHHTLKGRDPSDTSDPIDKSHLGPTIIYLAKVDNALNTNVQGLKWFKIYEDGLDSNGQWGVNRMINNLGKVSFTIPKCIPSGQYLLRAELIALHAAQSYPGAQFYMECAQINVTGGGSASPATVSFPGAYKGSDPGITFNLYYPVPKTYTVPGPAVFKC